MRDTRYAVVIACVVIACANNKAASEPTDAQPSYCDGLSDIRQLPVTHIPSELREPEEAGDEAFRQLLSHGSLAIPCLIDSITNMSTVPDQRDPSWKPGVRVGDLALILLYEVSGHAIVPPEISDRQSEIGWYAITEYTRNEVNARRLQSLWRSWYENNAASAGRK